MHYETFEMWCLKTAKCIITRIAKTSMPSVWNHNYHIELGLPQYESSIKEICKSEVKLILAKALKYEFL